MGEAKLWFCGNCDGEVEGRQRPPIGWYSVSRTTGHGATDPIKWVGTYCSLKCTAEDLARQAMRAIRQAALRMAPAMAQ